MSLPDGARVLGSVGGGDINQAFHVVLADGREAFVKTRPDAAPGEYEAEAAGLSWLGEPGALRVPEVLEVGEDHLAIEWIPRGGLGRDGEEELGHGLAAVHDAGSPVFGLQAAGDGDGTGPAGPRRDRAPGPLRLARAAQRPHRGLGHVLRRAAAAPAGPPGLGDGRAVARPGWRRWSGSASGWRRSSALPSRPLGCTVTCGRGT